MSNYYVVPRSASGAEEDFFISGGKKYIFSHLLGGTSGCRVYVEESVIWLEHEEARKVISNDPWYIALLRDIFGDE